MPHVLFKAVRDLTAPQFRSPCPDVTNYTVTLYVARYSFITAYFPIVIGRRCHVGAMECGALTNGAERTEQHDYTPRPGRDRCSQISEPAIRNPISHFLEALTGTAAQKNYQRRTKKARE
ncbi:unnamed protein product [Danaus chrysippus]|uniref:(African queen) hypothetical protein n=1 Tax=Danaus chrysippus TaxID=151541 RepID=A0A8J2QER7_9NEOP|nr:unnamed protein product [Danaus chrysippus]